MLLHSEEVINLRGCVLRFEHGSTQQEEPKQIETLSCSAGGHALKDKAGHTHGLEHTIEVMLLRPHESPKCFGKSWKGKDPCVGGGLILKSHHPYVPKLQWSLRR